MIPQLLEKTAPYKELIINDDILREYYNKLTSADRAYLLIALAANYYTTDNLIDIMLQLLNRSYISILSDDIIGFTSIRLNHDAYKVFFENKKYYLSSTKYDILLSIAGWIVKHSPNNETTTELLENISLSFMLVFIFDDPIDIPENILTFLDALGGVNNVWYLNY